MSQWGIWWVSEKPSTGANNQHQHKPNLSPSQPEASQVYPAGGERWSGKRRRNEREKFKQKNIGNPSSLTVVQYEITLSMKPFQIQTQQTGGILPPSS